MSAQNNSLTISKDVRELLVQIQERGTPLRIDGDTGTYYILSADQLMTLLSLIPEDAASVSSFTPQDFGLTEADLTAYEARRKARREQIDLNVLVPLDPDLEQRLLHLSQIQHQRPLSGKEAHEREQLLHELEAAMLRNLQAVVNKIS